MRPDKLGVFMVPSDGKGEGSLEELKILTPLGRRNPSRESQR